jgi:hypothetical protein
MKNVPEARYEEYAGGAHLSYVSALQYKEVA